MPSLSRTTAYTHSMIKTILCTVGPHHPLEPWLRTAWKCVHNLYTHLRYIHTPIFLGVLHSGDAKKWKHSLNPQAVQINKTSNLQLLGADC